MSPIAPLARLSPMLIGGPHAAGIPGDSAPAGFTGVEVFSGKLGAASAAKMCRSVLVKGLEALVLESLMTARRHGVEERGAGVAARGFPKRRLAPRRRATWCRAPSCMAPTRRGDARGGANGARSRAHTLA